MNIKNGTLEELAKLIGDCDDSADNHVIWVSMNGEVHVDHESEFVVNDPQKELCDMLASAYRCRNDYGLSKEGDREIYDAKESYKLKHKDTGAFMFHFETLCCGNGYVGKEAAKDSIWVSKLLGMLKADYAADTLGLSVFA